MDISLLLTFFHIIGVALGVGGATVSDILFFKALKDRRVSTDEFALLHTLGMILWVGLLILFLSGLGFVTSQLLLTGSSTYLVSAWFWAKMTIICILFCNAIAMHWLVFPFMQENLDTTLNYRKVRPKVVVLATTGVISITSWYSALTLGVTRGLDFSYLYIINLYFFLVASGILVAYVLFVVAIFPQSKSRKVVPTVSSTSQSGWRVLLAVFVTIVVGVVMVTLARYVTTGSAGHATMQSVTEHESGSMISAPEQKSDVHEQMNQ